MNKWILGTAFLFVLGCQNNENSVSQAPQKSAKDDISITKPNEDLLQRLTFKTVGLADWKTKLKVSGSIELDEKRVARVGTTVSGRVTEIKVLRGDVVQKGDILALVHSSSLAEAQMAYLKAHAAYNLAQQSVIRAKALFKEDVISRAELERRESERLSSEAEWRASRDRMSILGMSSEDIQHLEKTRNINSQIAMRSPITGVVIDRKVSQGEVLEPADLAYIIADLANVWVVGEVPERYSAQMRKDKEVQVVIPALMNEARVTKLSYVADIVTPQTRTLRIRALLDNANGRLKPEMLATLQIEGAVHKRLVIPSKAVFREDNTDKVFVEVSPGVFKATVVVLGEEEEDLRPVESGIADGQVIVVDGVFHLNAERLLKQQE